MKVELILIKLKNDLCGSEKQFISFLSSNSRVKFIDDKIQFNNSEMAYKLSSQVIKNKNNKKDEIVFDFMVSLPEESDENAATLENFIKMLRRTNDVCGNQFKINTVWDDVSIYYASKLYPRINNIENLLRKIIYRFMITNYGSNWFDQSVPPDVKESVKKTKEKNKEESDDITENHLYYADFIQLNYFLFQPFSLKPVDQNAIKKIRDSIDNNKSVLPSLLDDYISKSNWERHFENNISVDHLSEKWAKLYEYRNKVAHSKDIKKNEYEDAVIIISELSRAFETCLSIVDSVKLSDKEAETTKEVANFTLINNDFLNPKINYNSGYFTYTKIDENGKQRIFIKPIDENNIFRISSKLNKNISTPDFDVVDSNGRFSIIDVKGVKSETTNEGDIKETK